MQSEILIDITRQLNRLIIKGRLPTGVDRVCLEYIRHFADKARAVVWLGGRSIVLSRSGSVQLFEVLLNPRANARWLVQRRVGWELVNRLRFRKPQGAFLLNMGHSHLEQKSYAQQLQRLGVKPLFFVHDLIPLTHPEYCRQGESDKHILRMNNVLNLAHGVITNSQATLNELERHAQKTGQPMPPAVAALLAPAALPAPAAVRPVAVPYFVMLGTIEPRKNHWLILQLWRKLVERHGTHAPKLVLIGQPGWECENVDDLLERCNELRGVVTGLPACSDADLATYLHHAQALLFPSFVEGYGMPLAEALASGVPVIASDLPVFREIAGDIPDYLDPLDGTGWMAQIDAFTNSHSSARVAQLHRLRRFSKPTWSDHFQTVESLLEKLA